MIEVICNDRLGKKVRMYVVPVQPLIWALQAWL